MSVQVSLPAQLDFGKKPPSLPSGVDSKLMNFQAVNGITFSPNQVIEFQLPSQAGLYFDPKTLFVRYKITYTSGSTAGVVRGLPALTTFSKLDEFIGSTNINSVYNYAQVANMWYNINTNVAQKFGEQSSLGFQLGAAIPNLSQMESYTCQTAPGDNALYLSAPLICSAIGSADKFIPSGLMAPIRFQLTVAPISDQAIVAANITGITVSVPELCIQGINMGAQTDAMIASMGNPTLTLKTNGWANAGVGRIAGGSTGLQTIIINHRYRSIENLYCLFSGDSATLDLNGALDSRDLTSGNGSYAVQIGQSQFPSIPISTVNHKTSVLQYLRETIGSVQDYKMSGMSINHTEFSYNSSGTATTGTEPAKFILGIPLSKIQPMPWSSGALLSGVDASSSPISLLVNIGTATSASQNTNVFAIAHYSQLIEIDPMTKQVAVVF
jgi:hypothetical protein